MISLQSKNREYRYYVICLNEKGYEITSQYPHDNFKSAKHQAKLLVEDKELINSGLFRVQIQNVSEECMFDILVHA